MSYYILGMPREEYWKRMKKRKRAGIMLLFLTALGNILVCLFRTEETHMLFLILNIVTDTVVISILFFLYSTQYVVDKRLYYLASQEERGLKIRGKICSISETTEMIRALECREVTIEEEGTRKIYVSDEGKIPFELTGEAEFTVVNHMIIKAEEQK